MLDAIIIRTATAGDSDELTAVHVKAWQESYSDILRPIAFENMTVAKRTQHWRDVLTGADHPVFVAERDGQIVGFADGGPARPEDALGQEMQLYAIYLLNAVKRQGIGTKLLKSVMRQFLADGTNSACVWALRDAVPARRFYEHHGAQFAAEKLENRGDYERSLVGYVWRDLRLLFCAEAVKPHSDLPRWSFGADPQTADELLALVLAGRKTATCGPLWEYEAEGVALPKPGERSIIMDGGGVSKCIIQVIEITLTPFDKVDSEFAFDEGEDDRSLASWRRIHEDFFCGFSKFAPDMLLVCQRFRLIKLL